MDLKPKHTADSSKLELCARTVAAASAWFEGEDNHNVQIRTKPFSYKIFHSFYWLMTSMSLFHCQSRFQVDKSGVHMFSAALPQ